MDQHDAVLAAETWAAKFSVEFGECLWIRHYTHCLDLKRTDTYWCMEFAVKEHRPEWCWFVSIGDDGQERTLIAMRRPKRFMES
jgi:hypothetical protein